MKTQNNTPSVHEMNKQALKVYAGLAAIVYGLALTYCFLTDHFMEMGIVGGVMIVLGTIITRVYISFAKKSNHRINENSFRQAA